ncbi:amino acid adenylation domain-containing protein [Kitasatospora mediocidica]|uniref:amino acid adenylation domain-containing protein n=1 Tax=Kitasatospora mediocidica TaxID=58352 RepID=UPI00068A608D|nr:amino acid adenylation domain-containing protein [Kitasatospora mediocidica]
MTLEPPAPTSPLSPPSPPREHVALHALFAHWAAHTPQAPAVVDATGTHGYGALWQRAGQVAAALRGHGVRQDEVVATVLPRTAEQVVALLGILQAGGALLALDPAQPPARLRALTEDAGVRIVITDGSVEPPDGVSWEAVTLDALAATGSAAAATTGPADVSATALACLLYTSGSTGRPKGVLLTHAAVTNYARHQAESFALGPDDRVAQRAPYTSDAALSELVMAFAVGAAVVVLPLEALATPDAFARTLEQHRISMLTIVPSLLAPLVADQVFTRCPSLRVVVSVGEQLTRSLAADFARQNPAALYNLYGPSEAGIGVTAHRVTGTEPGSTIPIGHASAGLRVHVCSPDGEALAPLTPGELYVGGAQLSRGYLNRPALTAERFVPDPFSGLPGARLYRTGDRVRRQLDGSLEFVGRVDGQLKLRGVRVEPGEIEAAIQRHPAAKQAAVTVLTGGPGPDLLVAFVEWEGQTDGVPRALRSHLRVLLPAPMIPAVFHALPAFPLLPSGKTDRQSLADLAVRLRTESPR